MNTRSFTHRSPSGGLSLIGILWLVLTLNLEFHSSFPVTAAGWIKRVFGWGVEMFFAVILVKGIRRCAAAGQK